MKLIEVINSRGTYLFCPRCGSPAVSHSRPNVENSDTIRTEVFDVKCGSCGLRGRVEENWFWEG